MAFSSSPTSCSAGYFRYRCKNFYTYNCDNWVWVNYTACAECVACGRESDDLGQSCHISGGEIDLESVASTDFSTRAFSSNNVNNFANVLPPRCLNKDSDRDDVLVSMERVYWLAERIPRCITNAIETEHHHIGRPELPI